GAAAAVVGGARPVPVAADPAPRARGREARRAAGPALTPPKLVLTVIDGLAPAALERGVADGRAPTLAALLERGTYIDDCVAAFPSVTPVCTASIVTGAGPDEHRVPAMCWYLRSEERYVDYGSSFQATRAF